MKKTISIFLLMCFSLSLMGMASAETGSNEATIKGQILAYTEDWFTDNFSEHYDISDYEASVNNFQQSGAEIYAEIAACAVTTLKYNSVEELPYMEGIKDSLQINSLAEVIPVEYVTQQSAIAASELQKSVEFATSQSTTRLSLDANTQRSILTPQMVAENIVDSLDMPITEAQAANLSTHIADAYVDAAECIGVGTVLTMDLIFGATYIYLTAHGKNVYTLTAPTNLTSTSARVTWKPYTGSPEQIWKIKTSHTANMYSGHGRYLPSRQDSTVTPFIWPCYKKTGARGYNPSTPHYGIDRDSYYQCSDQRNAPGDPIYPICAGTVVKVYEKHADFGNSVWINSSNPNTTAITTGAYIRHLYMHFNSKPLVSVGDPVTTGTLLGYMGTTGNSTGVHLHFGIQARNTAYTSSDGYTTSGFFDPEIILK